MELTPVVANAIKLFTAVKSFITLAPVINFIKN